MGKHTTMTSTRGGNAFITTPFATKIDTMKAQEASYYGGAAPYFRYAIYVKSPSTFVADDFQQGDLLIDTDVNDLDLKTGVHKQYRVISDPRFYFDGHGEMIADRYRGK